MVPKGDVLGWQLSLVADGVRPAWLCASGEYSRRVVAARIRREAAWQGRLRLTPDLRVASDGMELGFLVTAAPVRVPPVVTHAWVGRQLGLPCSSADPWSERARVYALVGVRRTDSNRRLRITPNSPVGPLGYGWRVPCEAVVTTFWCPDASEAHAWCAQFLRHASRFQASHLAPRDLRLFYCVLAASDGEL